VGGRRRGKQQQQPEPSAARHVSASSLDGPCLAVGVIPRRWTLYVARRRFRSGLDAASAGKLWGNRRREATQARDESMRSARRKPADILCPADALELFTLALPIIGMMVSRLAMTFIDFAMVSALGTAAQAAISPASVFVFAIGCLGMGVAHAVQTFVSQADGRGEAHRAGSYAWQSFYIAAACGLLTVPFALTTEAWFGWIAALGQHSAEVADMEVRYIRISLWAVAPSVVCVGLNGFFNGIQKPRITLVAVLVSLVVNLIGNWLLIFGHLGLPRMEIAGAALATVIAWCARAGVLLWAMLLPRFDTRFRTRGTWRPRNDYLRGLLRVGGPTSVQWIVDIGAWLVFLVLILPPLGEVVLAASNIGLQYMHLSFMPAIGVGMALCSKVGFAIGEGRRERARDYTRVGLAMSAGYMGLIGLLFFLLRRPLVWVFNHDPAVIDVGATVLIWAAVFQVFDGMSIAYMNALRGAGDTRWPAVIVVIFCWVVFVGGGLAARTWLPQYGLNGPWLACTVYITLLGVLLMWRWNSGVWERIELLEVPEEAAVVPGVEAGADVAAGGLETAAATRAPDA